MKGSTRVELIEGAVRGYAWGSLTAIPDLLGRPATGEPWAELWFGAHPGAPALVGARAEPLDCLIARDPCAALGSATASRYGRLPFLLKVLAAVAPLSLQAHPSAQQAASGYQREQDLGRALDAPERIFRDPSHKPELICALSEFEALSGLRPPKRTIQLLDTLDAPGLDPLRHHLSCCGGSDDKSGDKSGDKADLSGLLRWLLTLGPAEATRLADATTEACATAVAEDEWTVTRSAVARLGVLHPGDVAVTAALLLNHVVLTPGEALFVGPGCLHVYLGGTAVELMAASDNVVRGGLTSKHVDIPVLLEIVDAVSGEARVQRPQPVDGVAVYETAVPEFSLRRLEVNGLMSVGGGPALLLCVDGCVQTAEMTLDRGSAGWVGATEQQVMLSGHGTLFCAGLGSDTDL